MGIGPRISRMRIVSSEKVIKQGLAPCTGGSVNLRYTRSGVLYLPFLIKSAGYQVSRSSLVSFSPSNEPLPSFEL